MAHLPAPPTLHLDNNSHWGSGYSFLVVRWSRFLQGMGNCYLDHWLMDTPTLQGRPNSGQNLDHCSILATIINNKYLGCI